ncbi:nucleotidyltransferase domain-containing protein [Pseudenhygromyxa sp. WMMC2535]|uniref:[protein-PII] uridylyltransferase family protein n=1 Tax=Pseudenhygromyxa sp. WMMC2535 TaxID=2712867 RepID=UPI001553C667|nr:nucleotidyltransferase domain-containing protein [Pseudenhygromyxa sp. WMMC2535]NVB41780.1 nucleotidyltransferase domain-containing protein [Pseudenhygromyxa sp. WMMC2535]
MSTVLEHEPVAPRLSLREEFIAAREAVGSALPEDPRGGALLHRFGERIVERITPACALAVGRAGSRFGKLAIVVFGGLARGEHCPYSDIDLTVLCTEPGQEGDEAFGEWIREFTHPLWDAGLRLRTTVQHPEGWLEAAAEDLSSCTALLDMRFLAGDRQLYDEVGDEAHRRFFGPQRASFLQRLLDEQGLRERRFGTTVYQVEPDLKFGPGGTRDISVFEWALMARRSRAEPWDPAKVESAIRASGVPRRVARLLTEARDTILRLRAALHLVAGRTQDRLNFQYQEGVPELLGRVRPGEPLSADHRELVEAIEACMQDYYQAARDIQRHGGRVVARCQPPRIRADIDQRIDERFHALDGRLRHYGKGRFAESPVLCLEALALARDHNLGLSGPTFDVIVEAVMAIPAGDERLANDPEAQARFVDLLIDPADVGSPTPLELCHEVGLLQRLVPEFAASRGRMQHEGLHVYTVDQHSLYAVEFLKSIARGDHRKDFPMATAVHLSVDDPRPLYMATLLHDAGKPFGDQCAEGARIAGLAAQRARLDEDAVTRCAFLVEQHQTMPMLSQKRDLTDELQIREFAELVGDRRTLDELYLVSLADMANVSPEYLTSWKLTLLDELYLRTAAEFASSRRRETTARRPREDEPEGLPLRYYSLFDQDLRREHRQLLDRLRESPQRRVLIDVAEGSGALRLTVVTPDHRGLLAVLTSCMAERGLEVMAADVFSVPFYPRIALDVFRVVPRDTGATLAALGANGRPSSEWVVQLERALVDALVHAPGAEALAEPMPPLPGRRRSKTRRRSTKVRFSQDPGGSRTIVDVETFANAGVAARISRSFAALDLDIEIARINTEMGRVDAVFYVSKLDDEQRDALAKSIRANLRTRRG